MLLGTDIVAALKKARVEFVTAVPDITTSAGLLWPIAHGQDFKLVRLCKEDEGVAVCAGLSITGHRAVLMIQHTGLLDSLNSVRGIACEQQLPVCMIVGLLAKEAKVPPQQSKSFGLRIVEPILDAMAIEHFLIEEREDVVRLPDAIDRAYAASRPMVALIGQTVTP